MKNSRKLLLIIISLVLCSPIYAEKAIRPTISVVPKKPSPKPRPLKDSDNDGVPDKADQCPNEKGTKSNDGCPEVNSVLPDGIHFDTGKFAIKPIPNPTLDKIVSGLKANAGKKVTISGHTDNKKYDNQKLSEDRANAVKAYLVKGGIDASRITTVGYGDTKPIADNATEAGRAKNCRIEFEIK